jgi:threonine 3-dehydrogenase
VKALMKEGAAPGFVLKDVPEPSFRDDEVLIRVHRAGVCGTDVHIYQWDAWAQGRVKPPIIVGHEFAGEVVRVGQLVTDVREGDRVTAEGHIVDGRCLLCRTGNSHVCPYTKIIGVDRDGCFAEYIAMPATRIIASDINDTRLSLAARMGAHDVVHPDEAEAVVKERTGGLGVDVVLEMSGVASAIHQAFSLVRVGGRVQMLGIPAKPIEVDFSTEIIFKGLTVYGVVGRRMYDTWLSMTRFLRSGQFDPTPVITHRFPLDGFDDAMRVIKSGDAGKVIFEIA